MSFMGGFTQGLAGGLSEQIDEKRADYRNSVDNYRKQAHTAYQSYVKTMGEQKAFKREIENFSVQHFDGDHDAARSYLALHNNDISKANKAALDYGVPTIVGRSEGPSLDTQGQELGFAGQAMQQGQANPAQQGVMDHVMSIGKRLFGPVDINDVRSHVAQEMGMSPDELQGIMSGQGMALPDYNPVQFEQNRVGLSDLSSPNAALLKFAAMDPGTLPPHMQRVHAEANRLVADSNRATAAAGGGVNPFDYIRTNNEGGTTFDPNSRRAAGEYHREVEEEPASITVDLPDGTIVNDPNGVPHVVRNGIPVPL